MMHHIIRFILCFTVILLASCANQFSVERINHRAMCINTCKLHVKECSKTCENNCQQCNQLSNDSTSHNYNKYKHEQCVQGGVIARDLNSYRDPLQCRKISCDCLADYTLCAEACDGIIHKRLQIAPVCCA